MKKTKVVLMAFAIMALFLFFTQPASADMRWMTLTVDCVETDSTGEVVLTLTTATGRTRWFIVPAGEENRMLAVALTAMTNGWKVRAHVDWPNSGTEIDCIRLTSISSS